MSQPLPRLNAWNLGKGVLEPTPSIWELGQARLSREELSAPSAKAQTPKPKGRTVRPVRGSMNQSEGRYARHLERQVAHGEIAAFWFEPLKFRLADKTYYSPDFMVMGNDGLLSLHELKGWMEDDAAVKLKVTAEAYWIFPIRLVKEKRGIFTVTEVGR